MTEYTSRVEEILNGTFTGEPQSRVEALLIAWIQSGGGGGTGGTTNYNLLRNLPKINNVELKGNVTLESLGISGGSLTKNLIVTKPVGGITSGIYPEGTPIETVLRDLLNPVEAPSFTNPTVTISSTAKKLLEPGQTQIAEIIVSFNRGVISPAYGTSGYRAGQATGYRLNNGTVQTSNVFNVTVTESNNRFVGKVSFAAGEQPKDSKGNDFGSPLSAGEISSSELKFEYVNAIWSNSRNILNIDKEDLISKSAGIKTFKFPAQTLANPQIFDIPASWNVTAVETYNTLSQGWQNGASSFNVTDTTHDGIAYKRYTDNRGAAAGARDVRVKWTP